MQFSNFCYNTIALKLPLSMQFKSRVLSITYPYVKVMPNFVCVIQRLIFHLKSTFDFIPSDDVIVVCFKKWIFEIAVAAIATVAFSSSLFYLYFIWSPDSRVSEHSLCLFRHYLAYQKRGDDQIRNCRDVSFGSVFFTFGTEITNKLLCHAMSLKRHYNQKDFQLFASNFLVNFLLVQVF